MCTILSCFLAFSLSTGAVEGLNYGRDYLLLPQINRVYQHESQWPDINLETGEVKFQQWYIPNLDVDDDEVEMEFKHRATKFTLGHNFDDDRTFLQVKFRF